MSEQDNNDDILAGDEILDDTIQERIKTEQGFRLFVAMALKKTNTCLNNHGRDIRILKEWKAGLIGAWTALLVGSACAGSVIGYLIAIFVK